MGTERRAGAGGGRKGFGGLRLDFEEGPGGSSGERVGGWRACRRDDLHDAVLRRLQRERTRR